MFVALAAIFVTVLTCHSQINHPHHLLLEMTLDFRQCFMWCYQHEGCGSFKFSPKIAQCLGYLTGYEDERPSQDGYQQYRLCRSRGCPAREHFVRLRGSGMCLRVSEDAMGWESARESCRKHHSDLVVINTKKKARSLKRYILSTEPYVKNEDYKWVGMRRQPSSRRYAWVRGRSSWAPWAVGDPSYGAEMCVFFSAKKGVADIRCHDKKRFICEISNFDD